MTLVTKNPVEYRLSIAWARLWSAVAHKTRLSRLGRGSFIQRPALLLGHRNISIGDRTSIRSGARIEAQARFSHRVPRLVIGSDTNIEQNVHIMCQSRVTIGDRVSITGNCAIVDISHPVGPDITKIGSAITDEDSFVEIDDDVFVGFGAVILPNVRIGRGAVIGANSVVTTDIPALAIAAGAPARIVRMRDGCDVG
jgi:acetyltransferase-like isoleucine patch superfamily enzyme